MIDVEYISIDGIDYIVLNTITINQTEYLYLVNENDETKFCIRKVVKENNQEYIVNLSDENEFELAMKAFVSKQKTA